MNRFCICTTYQDKISIKKKVVLGPDGFMDEFYNYLKMMNISQTIQEN